MSRIQDITIPEGWEITKFNEILIKFQNGYAFNAKNYTEYGNPIVKMGNISLDGSFSFNKNRNSYCSYKEYCKLKDFWVKINDLLIAMTDVTPNKDLIGRATIVNIDKAFVLNQRVGLLKIKEEKYNKNYIKYYCNFDFFRDYSKAMSGLSAQANLGTEDIKNAEILLPQSLKEQEKIAEILSTVDEVIENTDRLIEKYKKIKAGLMEDLFTRGIDIQIGKPHTKFKDSDLGRIPESWEVVKLGDILKVGSGSGLSKENMKLGKHLVYGGNGINGIHNAYTLKDEELIIGRVGEYCGNSVITKPFSWVTDNALIVRFIKKQNMVYWNYFLNYFNLNQFAYSAAQPVITGGIIYNILVKIPCFKEEEKIAEILTEANNKIKKEEAYKEKLEKIKKGLMNDLLTGKIRVKF